MTQRRYAFFFSAFMVLLILGVAFRISQVFSQRNRSSEGVHRLPFTQVEGRLQTDGTLKEGKQYVRLNEITIITEPFPQYKKGEYVKVALPKGTANSFAYFPHITTSNASRSQKLIQNIRSKIIARCEELFHEPYASVALGMLFGIQDTLSDQLIRQFRTTGTLHILVVSGYNVGLVLSAVFFPLRKLRKGVAFIVCAFVLCCYGGIIGFGFTFFRAALMGTVGLYARISGVSSLSWYRCILALCCILLVSPSGIFDIGFQLSCVATIAILLGQTLYHPTRRLFQELFLSFVVTILVIPIISYYFGTVTFLSIIATPLVSLVLPLLYAGMCIVLLLPVFLMRLFCVVLLEWVVAVVSFGSNLPYASLPFSMTEKQVGTYYLFCLAGYLLVARKRMHYET